MSLFAEYPPDEPKEPKAQCCAQADLHPPSNITPRTWEMTHAYGHSRIPISAAAMALALSIPTSAAHLALRAGVNAGWLTPAMPERHEQHPTPCWIGCLPRNR
jgi:hypothetical protein